MIIVFLGPPLSGKSLQAKLLSNRLGFKYLSTGELLRKEVANNTDLGKKIKEYLDKGELVPDGIVNHLLAKNLSGDVVLDGYPRTEKQAWFLDKIAPPEIVFVIELDEEEVLKRAEGRRVCSKCGAVYNVYGFPKPKEEGICDSCGGELVSRTDDDIELVEKRLEQFQAEIDKIKDYYKDRCYVLQGALSADELAQDIEDLVYLTCVRKKIEQCLD